MDHFIMELGAEKTIKFTDLVNWLCQMEVNIWGNFDMANSMGRELSCFLINRYMKVYGKQEKCKVKAFWNLQMGKNLKECLKIVWKMVMAFIHCRMDEHIWDFGWMVKCMEKEFIK